MTDPGFREWELRAVAAGAGRRLPAEDEEARGVLGVVLNVMFQDGQTVLFGGQEAGDGGGVLLFRGELGAAGVAALALLCIGSPTKARTPSNFIW